jgi:hypothetical protein
MKFRRCRKYTSYESGKVVELNPGSFRNLSIPFNGETEEDFLNYLNDNMSELEEIKDEMDIETYQKIMEIYQPEFESGYTEYYNSSVDEEETWLESGEVHDEEEFETFLSTNN